MKGRRRSASAQKAPLVAAPPIVVTLDSAGEVIDMVGDLSVFVAEGEGAEDIIGRLVELVSGTGEHPEVLQAVELSRGHYADIHIVKEGDARHFVLLDATDLVRTLQGNQQLSNEAALEQEREQRELTRNESGTRLVRSGVAFRRGAGVFSSVVSEMREPLALLAGHVGILARHCSGDGQAMRSIAAIQHAVVRLEALSTNGLIALGGLSSGASAPGAVDLHQLAAFLQDAFVLQAQAQGLGFEVFVPVKSGLVVLDDLALRQVLVNLVVHALDGMGHGVLELSLSTTARHVDVEINAQPSGFVPALFGPLVTTSDLLQSNATGSLALAVSQQILRRMEAKVELVPLREGGYAVWFRVPLRARGRVEDRRRKYGDIRVGLAISHASLAEEITRALAEMGATAFDANDLDQQEAVVKAPVAVGALVVEGAGGSGNELLRRWLVAGLGPALLIESGGQGTDGWSRDGDLIRISASHDPQSMREALSALLWTIEERQG